MNERAFLRILGKKWALKKNCRYNVGCEKMLSYMSNFFFFFLIIFYERCLKSITVGEGGKKKAVFP